MTNDLEAVREMLFHALRYAGGGDPEMSGTLADEIYYDDRLDLSKLAATVLEFFAAREAEKPEPLTGHYKAAADFLTEAFAARNGGSGDQ